MNLCQLQSLQEKANFLRCFVPDYATCMHGFLHLLHHDIPFRWDEHTQTTFDDLKEALSIAPLIIPTYYDRDYILYLSASAVSIVGVLVQLGEDGREHAIYYISKNILGPPLKYNHDEKLALAVHKLCHYILLRTNKFIEYSNPMQYFLSQRQINGRFSRWIVILQEYDLELSTPKINKSLVLTELIMMFPSYSQASPVNMDFTNEQLSFIP
jgi:hypothetical protein